ncbi:hypothetical protein [Microbispora sp. NPDC046933]|uniref:hypothetical protein n=1 Tax=Microbispora sp. NPDC046933 TaxID=3155618 RepID=UPI0033F7401E
MSDGGEDTGSSTGSRQVRRRRQRQAVPRPHVVKFVLTEDEYADFRTAAQRLGLAHGAYAQRRPSRRRGW